jgi:hypothetical protein
MMQNPLFPWLNWMPDTRTNTNTFIGCNIEEEGDGPVEQHVLDKVGSYGYQLNRIIDVMKIVVSQSGTGALSGLHPGSDEQAKIDAFLDMAKKASEASDEYKKESADRLVERTIQNLRQLRSSQSALDRQRYEQLRQQLAAELPEAK